MELSEGAVKEAHARLRRAAGQILGVERMLGEGRECRDILPQLSAASRALEQAGLRLLASGYAWCSEHPEKAAENGCSPEQLEELFLGMATRAEP